MIICSGIRALLVPTIAKDPSVVGRTRERGRRVSECMRGLHGACVGTQHQHRVVERCKGKGYESRVCSAWVAGGLQ